MSNNNSSSSGIGLTGALFLVLLVLKLTGYIDWSWWWITAPLWGGIVFLIVILIIALLIGSSGSNKDIHNSRTQSKSKFQERLEKMARDRAEKQD